MRARGIAATAVLGALAGAVAGAPGALATTHASARSCHLVTDPSGDTESVGPDDDSQLDILGGDFAMNRSTLTVVVKVTALTAEDITEPAGRIYEYDFTANGKNFIAMASLLPGGSEFQAFISDQRIEQGKSGARAATGIGTMTGTLDLQAHEVRMSAPLSVFTRYASFSQTNVDHFAAFTYRAHGESLSGTQVGKVVDVSGSTGITVDEAWSKKVYRPYAPSCVKVGH
jgi:hypothetical protein